MADIAAALRTQPTPELTPGLLAFDDGGLAQSLPGFNGFEAIVVAGDQVYATIENRSGGGWVVRGAQPIHQRIQLVPGHGAAVAGAGRADQHRRRRP